LNIKKNPSGFSITGKIEYRRKDREKNRQRG